MSEPVRYQPSFETIQADEPAVVDELNASLHKIAGIVFEDSGHASRGVHAKSHGIVRGELTVLSDLPATLAQGVFAAPLTIPVIMRFSTSPGDLLDDEISTPRAVAIKLIGVSGERLPGSEADNTQDFLMVNGPNFLKPDAKSFASGLKMLAATTDKAPGLKKVLSAVLRGSEKLIESVGSESAMLKGMGGHPLTHILGETFYTQVPFLYGENMAKLSIAPVSENLRALTDAPVDLEDKPSGLREAVVEFFNDNDAQWEVRVQLCTDVEKMPIEDASQPWPEELSPYIAVARIKVLKQQAWDATQSTQLEDRLSFSPWHGIAAHRPLGSVNRARKLVYASSVQFRSEHNGCPIHEPRTL